MNREDIIRMAEQADEAADRKIKMRGEYHPDWHQVRDEAFVALVAAEVSKCEGCGAPHALYCLKCCEESIVQTAVKEEREACALVLDKVIEHLYIYNYDGDASTELRKCAKAIRARGKS